MKNRPIKAFLKNIAIDDKIRLVMGTGMRSANLPDHLEAPAVGEFSESVPGAAGSTYAVPAYDIPPIVLADGPAGIRINPTREDDDQRYYATAFPIATLLSSTWDTALVEEVGKAMGEETREYGGDVLLAPALNIHRYPLGGRNFEYYSEDPLLSGKIAAAAVRGIQSAGVGACIKHFVANNHEWNRYVLNVKVNERELREIYLRGFEIAVKESQPWTLMSSYNQVNGEYTSESFRLLTTILREEWGYRGCVMTDWFAGKNPVTQLKAGNDLLMPGTEADLQTLQQAVKSEQLDESDLDKNLEKILDLIAKVPASKSYDFSNQPDLKKHATLARRAASQGMVLLKNTSNALPLKKNAIALFGVGAYDIAKGGTGSGDVNAAYTINLAEGLHSANFCVDTTLQSDYEHYLDKVKQQLIAPEPHLPPPLVPEAELSNNDIAKAAKTNDIALIVIKRSSGEFSDRAEKDDFVLSKIEQQLINRVSQSFHEQSKPIVVVLNIGGVIETSSWRDQVDAILVAWQPGQEAGHAITDVLCGKVNPSGKLPMTFAIKLHDHPAHHNFPGVVLDALDPKKHNILVGDNAAEIEYKDGIFVGYRHFCTSNTPVAYPFGFGLSYTTFEYQDLQLEQNSEALNVTLTVKNSGDVSGREIVQLYFSPPASALKKSKLTLCGFAKTRILESGASETINVCVPLRTLASWDENDSNWVVDAGSYSLFASDSSESHPLKTTFELRNPIKIPA